MVDRCVVKLICERAFEASTSPHHYMIFLTTGFVWSRNDVQHENLWIEIIPDALATKQNATPLHKTDLIGKATCSSGQPHKEQRTCDHSAQI